MNTHLSLSAPIRDTQELRLLHEIRRVARTLELTFPLSEQNAATVGRIVQEKMARRARINARQNALNVGIVKE